MKSRTSDALQILRRLPGETAELEALRQEERTNLEVAHAIIDLRKKHRLSQGELAKRIGTTQSVISRLEDADYEGHSLSMLKRIAEAVDMRLEVRFVRPKAAAAARTRRPERELQPA